MTGWQSPMNGHEIGQFWGDGEGQRGLACCSPWGHKESDMNGQLNNNKIILVSSIQRNDLSLYVL